MDQQTITALKKSIAHWKRMRDETHPDEAPYTDECALCDVFFAASKCRGCPVAKKTGVDCCNGTPYSDAYEAHENNGNDSPEFKAEADKMLRFLMDLLPIEFWEE